MTLFWMIEEGLEGGWEPCHSGQEFKESFYGKENLKAETRKKYLYLFDSQWIQTGNV